MVTKPKHRTPKERIARSASIIGNLPNALSAYQRLNRDHTVPLESVLTRCIKHIKIIRRFAPHDVNNPPKTEVEEYAIKTLRQAYKTYEFLQNFKPRVGERQHWNPVTKEFSLDAMETDEDGEYTLLEDGVVETSAPDLYSGGLGYRHINWDAEYLMAQPKGKHINPYWRPDLPRNQPGTKEHREMLSLEESGYWACQPREPDKWYEKMGWTLVESSNR